MLNIRSRRFDRTQYYNFRLLLKPGPLIKFSKEITNNFAKITNDERFLEVIRGKFKTLSNI